MLFSWREENRANGKPKERERERGLRFGVKHVYCFALWNNLMSRVYKLKQPVGFPLAAMKSNCVVGDRI